MSDEVVDEEEKEEEEELSAKGNLQRGDKTDGHSHPGKHRLTAWATLKSVWGRQLQLLLDL